MLEIVETQNRIIKEQSDLIYELYSELSVHISAEEAEKITERIKGIEIRSPTDQ